VLTIRGIEDADLDAAIAVHCEAFDIAAARVTGFLERRFRHLLRTDPAGAFIAAGPRGKIIGVSLAMRRGSLWALSLLAVAKSAQSDGVGAALIERALGYARAGDARVIISSDDPRARHLYDRTGHEPRSALEAKGRVDRGALAPSRGVTRAGPEALDFCDRIDQAARGHRRRPDLEFWLGDRERELWLVDDRRGTGYAIATSERLVTLAATTEPAARDLMTHVLSRAGSGEFLVSFIGEHQLWAREVLLAGGLPLERRGAIYTRGAVGSWELYVPNGALI
jgi:GNAT superfamily N-acetyltransferase